MASHPSAAPVNPSLSSIVEIYFSAKDLPNMDTFSKSDPFVVMYVQSTLNTNNQQRPTWTEYSRTEIIQDNLNPEWATQIKIEYHFEIVQNLRFEVYDEDKANSKKLTDHDFIGSCEVSLSGIMGARGQAKQLKLQNPKIRSPGLLTIRGEELRACSEFLKMRLSATNLQKGLFEKLQPMFSIWKMREDGAKQKIFESEYVNYRNKRAGCKEFDISVQAVCNADYERPIYLRCSSFRTNKEARDIGEVQTTLRKLMEGVNSKMDLFPVEVKGKKVNRKKSTGQIILSKCDLTRKPTFLEFIRGGCELNLLVAIDFTASNGAPSTASSLHYINPRVPNEYENAIQAVGNILESYDSDNMYPVYGFGGQIQNKTQHCFPLNFNPSQPEVHGVQGILNAYRNCFRTVSLSGPTIFSKILQMAINQTREEHNSQQHQSYNVLLILTDGIINDMQDTIDNIVEASDMGLSIIIVGVGGADFSSMEQLDADEEPLRARSGKLMKRDIVQFVPFRKYCSNPSVLTREVLAEVPAQLLSFMASKGIKPNEAQAMAVAVEAPAAAVLPPTAAMAATAVAAPVHAAHAVPTAAHVAGAVVTAAPPRASGYAVAATTASAPMAQHTGSAALQPSNMREEDAIAAAMAASMQTAHHTQPPLPTPPPAPSAASRWGSAIRKVQAVNRFKQRQTMTVVCPAGVYPGHTIQIALPSGQLRQVVVPAGVTPGSPFTVVV